MRSVHSILPVGNFIPCVQQPERSCLRGHRQDIVFLAFDTRMSQQDMHGPLSLCRICSDHGIVIPTKKQFFHLQAVFTPHSVNASSSHDLENTFLCLDFYRYFLNWVCYCPCELRFLSLGVSPELFFSETLRRKADVEEYRGCHIWSKQCLSRARGGTMSPYWPHHET